MEIALIVVGAGLAGLAVWCTLLSQRVAALEEAASRRTREEAARVAHAQSVVTAIRRRAPRRT